MAWMSGEQVSDQSKSISYARSSNNGTSWTVGAVVNNSGTTIKTRRDGVSATYDPNEGRFVIAYLGDNFPQTADCNEQAGGGGYICDDIRFFTVKVGWHVAEAHAAYACWRARQVHRRARADLSSGLGQRACVMSWVSTTGSACVHWGRFDVEADGKVTLYEDYAVDCIWLRFRRFDGRCAVAN